MVNVLDGSITLALGPQTLYYPAANEDPDFKSMIQSQSAILAIVKNNLNDKNLSDLS